MKKETLIKKLETQIGKIQDCIDEIASLLEIDSEDDDLSEMSLAFREQIEYAIHENEECNLSQLLEYIRENL